MKRIEIKDILMRFRTLQEIKDNITATVILPRQLGFIYHKSWIVLFNIHRRTKTCEIKFLLLQD